MSGRHLLEPDEVTPVQEPLAADLITAEPPDPAERETDPLEPDPIDQPDPDIQSPAPEPYTEPREEHEPSGDGPPQWAGEES